MGTVFTQLFNFTLRVQKIPYPNLPLNKHTLLRVKMYPYKRLIYLWVKGYPIVYPVSYVPHFSTLFLNGFYYHNVTLFYPSFLMGTFPF